MRSLPRSLAALLAAVSLLGVSAGCGGDDNEAGAGGTGAPPSGTTGERADAIKRDPANEGKRVALGSRDAGEQRILAEIYAQALEAAGFTVSRDLKLGSEQAAYRALKRGSVDLYPEYTGTALTSFYRVRPAAVPRKQDEAFELLSEKAAADELTLQPMAPFQTTQVVTSTKETAEKYGNAETLSEVAEAIGPDSRISGFPECRLRSDCFLGLRQIYEWKGKFVASERKFGDLPKKAEFTLAFSTDGELAQDKYEAYIDDKQLFPSNKMTLITAENGVETLGDGGRRILRAVQEGLTDDVMQELNSRVTLDKQEPEAVAGQYLQESGYVN